jgi:glycerol-3-phosphate acyltransferase PlsY
MSQGEVMQSGVSGLAVLAAYLLGSIPFGYLVASWVKGIDIRTVGSGNLGATNVGRILGFRYFLLVLALDALKGLVPTLVFPVLVGRLTGSSPAALPVLIALAAILGHTFPVYLKFRGGKGVATSLGAVLALDPISCAVAAAVFGVLLVYTRYMSLSSLAGGLAFVAAHFARDPAPWSREHLAMSLFSIAVVVLLFVRHRTNLARIRAGTENRVNVRWPRPRGGGEPHPSGRIVIALAIGLAVMTAAALAGIWLVHNAGRSVEAVAGPWVLREIDRVTSGQQRIDRVAFAADGTRLAGICPRYNRLLVYQVDAGRKLRAVAETALEGRPVSIAALGSRFVVLERPAGDEKHLEPGWWELFDDQGRRVGLRQPAGFYPDDLATTPEGGHLVVLSSGSAEGDARKPRPALEVLDVDRQGESARLVGRITFDPADDPQRLTLSATGRFVAVFLGKCKQTEAVDLTTPESPRRMGRTKAVTTDLPYVSATESDWIMMSGASDGETIAIERPGDDAQADRRRAGSRSHRADYLISARPQESALEIVQVTPRHSLGRFPLWGPLNLGRTRPTGLAYSAGSGLLAVATRSGTVHLIEVRSRLGAEDPRLARMARSQGLLSR